MSPIATPPTPAPSNGPESNGPESNGPESNGPEASGPEYWRSLEHLAQSPEVQQYIENEFPSLSQAMATTDRRQFLRLLGASLALAGIGGTGCRRWPVEEVRPHTSRAEGFSPGIAEHYATAIELNGVATGLLAKSYDGRPIKIEGNPEHPFSLGAASAHAQASVLELYDPDRSRHVIQRHRSGPGSDAEATKLVRSWADFQAFANPHFQSLRQLSGEGLAMLVQPTSSPTWQRLRTEFEVAMPKARWFEYQPLHRDNEYAGSRAGVGRALRCQYDLRQAQTIVLFDADLLGSHPAHLKLAADWAAGRRSVDQGHMNRLYVVESGTSISGSVADVRLPLKPSLVQQSVAYLAHRLGILPNQPGGLRQQDVTVLEGAVRDLVSAGAKGIVAAGPAQDANTHQLIHAINQHLGNTGHTLSYTDEPLAGPSGCVDQIGELSELLRGNVINTLVMVGGNPLYDAPADAPLNIQSSESRQLTSIHLSLHDDETSQACTWHLPAAHFLESWGDGRAWDGTYALQQPLILPLFDGKSPIELQAILSQSQANGLRLVRSTYEKHFSGSTQQDWEQTLHDGVRVDSQYPVVNAPAAKVDASVVAEESVSGWEVRFVADVKSHDGRFANNAWLQELPEPLTKLTWDNAALVSGADADRLDLATGDVVQLSVGQPEASIEVPVYVMPGHASGCMTLPLGYGRTRAGHIGNGVGVNVYPIRGMQSSYRVAGCELAKTGRQYELATTQEHDIIDAVGQSALVKRLGERGKPGMIVHETLLDDYQHDHHAVHGSAHAVHAAPLFDLPNGFDSPHKWGMSIDLNACIGCGGCVMACQAENNIPVVGKANVAVNREMHWLRIDRYFKGDVDQPDVVHLPMACAHCENAPCEQVCPVAATVHDSEGLNAMVYNRCVGTRYCANNCPYKVRRFNYFDFQASDPRTPAKPWLGIPDQQQAEDVSTLKKMVHNPEVTVRMRGVMEKCTYCVQRIVDARIGAKNEYASGQRESDLVAEGDLQTACQATCPTRAIVFGDLNDPKSAVSQARSNARSYEILEEQNLGARTTYLAKIRNRERA
jgi:MoCo/4Fe-4S cofactor protein with predicted Tat translocation signal